MREVTAREVQHEGKKRWRVIIPRKLNSGKQGRRYFTGTNAKKLAERFADRLEALRSKAGVAMLAWPQEKQVAFMHAGETMGERWPEIGEAVRAHMATKTLQSVPVTQAVAECMAEKGKGNLSERYKRSLSSTLERFALGKAQTPIDSIGPNQIEDFINREGLKSAASRRSQLIDLRTLFSYAVRRGYARVNVASQVAMPQRDEMEPGILTVEQVKTVLAGVRKECPEITRFVALVLFGGARPDEAKQLTEKAVHDGYIEIPAKVSKTNRRRLIRVNDTFLAWWNLGGELPLQDWKARKVREFVRPWPHDALRHSFVTYHHAMFGEVETSLAAGHSIAVMHKHYRALVTEAEARKFWELKPETVGSKPAP